MPGVTKSPSTGRKRKLDDDPAIEIDLSAPEPPSKKALRKAKRKGGAGPGDDTNAPAPAITASSDDVQKEHPRPSEKRTKYGIWIGNLAFSINKDDLRSFLTTQSAISEDEITRIHLPNDPSKRKGVHQNKGFAYVDFTSSDAVQQAVALSEQALYGRRVLIKDATDFVGRPEKQQAQHDGPSEGASKPRNAPSRKVFVGNLAFDVTKEMLEEHFGRCGPITMIHMATFEDSGKCKGYAWVEFETIEAAEAAVRGSVKVPDEDASDDSDEEEGAAAKKQKMKKIWVNRLLGRTLRTEFAEDPATRYQKRFGKEGQRKGADTSGHKTEESNDAAPAIEEVSKDDAPATSPGPLRNNQRQKPKSKVQTRNGYSEDTVQRLSGAIVAAQGKKTTFD